MFLFHFRYLWSGLIVVFGIYLNVYSKRSKLTFADLGRMASTVYRRVLRLPPAKDGGSRTSLLEV